MPIEQRPYTSAPGFNGDYKKVRDFLVRINRDEVVAPGFLWGRWEWFFSLTSNALDKDSLSKIGIWEDAGQIVALATYEAGQGEAYLCLDEKYPGLKNDMLAYAKLHLGRDGAIKAVIPDTDRAMQRLAFELGFRPTQEKECNAALDIREDTLQYILPDGFRVASLADEYDLKKYNRVLWRGFNHGDEPPETAEMLEARQVSLSGPNADMNLKIAAVNPCGEFVSFCGMWHEPGEICALVEPVATDPAYRRKGMGRAAVLEAIRRCGERGAKKAFVGSSQQFYYSIGFYPFSTDTFWECKI